MTYLEQAIKDGYAYITGEEGKRKIIYVTSDNRAERYDDPEVFTDSIKVDDRVLRAVVTHIESINLNATDLEGKRGGAR